MKQGMKQGGVCSKRGGAQVWAASAEDAALEPGRSSSSSGAPSARKDKMRLILAATLLAATTRADDDACAEGTEAVLRIALDPSAASAPVGAEASLTLGSAAVRDRG